jgi:hypothetical protein
MKNEIKETKETSEKINKLLGENPLAFPAIELAEFLIKKYDKEDWQMYERETGNKRVDYVPPKNSLEALIDEATGYKEVETLNYAKFLLWCVEGFIEGLNEKI